MSQQNNKTPTKRGSAPFAWITNNPPTSVTTYPSGEDSLTSSHSPDVCIWSVKFLK